MSASLVGSEMCIRDRNPHYAEHPPRRDRAKRCSRKGAVGRTSSRRVEPVSYTHLTLPTICSV
eukprot:10227609-Alexandrium_andersonii.AAC.1